MSTATVILLIAYAMPGNVPDIAMQLPEPSLRICWQEAQNFVDRGVPDIVKAKGAIGAYAGCRASSAHTVEE